MRNEIFFKTYKIRFSFSIDFLLMDVMDSERSHLIF